MKQPVQNLILKGKLYYKMPYWYKNVHQSTGFAKQKTSERELPGHCEPLYKLALPYYEKLASYIN